MDTKEKKKRTKRTNEERYGKQQYLVDPCVVGRIFKAGRKNYGEAQSICAVMSNGDFGGDFTKLMEQADGIREKIQKDENQELIASVQLAESITLVESLLESLRGLIAKLNKLGRRYPYARLLLRRIIFLNVVIRMLHFLLEVLPLLADVEAMADHADEMKAKYQCDGSFTCEDYKYGNTTTDGA